MQLVTLALSRNNSFSTKHGNVPSTYKQSSNLHHEKFNDKFFEQNLRHLNSQGYTWVNLGLFKASKIQKSKTMPLFKTPKISENFQKSSKNILHDFLCFRKRFTTISEILNIFTDFRIFLKIFKNPQKLYYVISKLF